MAIRRQSHLSNINLSSFAYLHQTAIHISTTLNNLGTLQNNFFNMIQGIDHINLVVPTGTLDQAQEFYGQTLGLTSKPVPHLQKGQLAWFDIGTSGQQVHIAHGKPEDFNFNSSQHPCFRLANTDDLLALRQKIWEHHERGGESAPQQADKPGEEDSGAKGVEYPTRFFARDYAGNRLEFTIR
jgi:catechol 2,3-dioxygenase-like lactoylglutathione lyase family enzyme